MKAKLCLLPLLLLTACGDSASVQPPAGPVVQLPIPKDACAPGNPAMELTGSVSTADAKTYLLQPFTVAAGTERVEVSYRWTERANNPPNNPLTATTLDLGLWDERGTFNAEGFRGWGGSRQGRIDREQSPSFVQEDSADRGYVPGAVKPGVWTAELGIAAVSPNGADYLLKIECKLASSRNGPLADDPVDKTHVANFAAGWYLGDFHMHGFHSQPNGPDDAEFIAQARAGQLDFLMVTDYVTDTHWRTLGAMQRANPDLVIWPGREIITYFGHANTHGETPSVLDYRHGLQAVSLGEIQKLAKQDDALFQVNHPTLFPPPAFSNLCRGCFFELDEAIDYAEVDTMEVVTGPIVATGDDVGAPIPAGSIEQPFVATAIQKWEGLLLDGFKITAVSGSDSKGVDAPEERARKGYGSSATAVFADQLSRPALKRAIEAGRAYVRTRGAAGSPEVLFEASAPNGQEGIYGDTLRLATTEVAALTTTVTGGVGNVISYIQNGVTMLVVPVLTDPFVHSLPTAMRNPANEGPLGTHWRIELADGETRTIIGNPVFLKAP
ncbi:MAG: CehA/McbA family metallohydrolase [Pseudomonadota bacterium]